MAQMSFKEYRSKVLGCFLGKSAGGTLGGPYEGKTGPLSLSYYDPVPTQMLPNDDLDLQVVWMETIRRKGLPINRRWLADAWLENIHLWPDEYGVAARNLTQGLYPPASGSYDNFFSAGMGAAIRSEIWACLAPGDPDLAVSLAREDACVDHDAEGVYACVYLTALESQAFIESDREKLLDRAASYIPQNSRLARAISDTRSWWAETRDWLVVREKILREHGMQNWTDVAPNLAFTVLGWLAGGNDFGKAICTAVNCGLDTDCTGATLGALLGIIEPGGMGEQWLKPIGRELVLSPGMVGMHHVRNLDDFCDQVCAMAVEVSEYYGAKVSFTDICGMDEERPHQSRFHLAQGGGIALASDYSANESLIAVDPLSVNVVYPSGIAFYPDTATSVTANIYNPGKCKVQGTLSITVPDGWTIEHSNHNISIECGEMQSVSFHVAAPPESAVRVYLNMMDFNFNINGLSWSASAGMIQTIPWLRLPVSKSIDTFEDIPFGGAYEKMEAAGHTQTIPEGKFVFVTEIKMPYHAIVHYVAQGTRGMKVWLDGRLINSHDGSFYVPAMHRNRTGVNVDHKRGWHRIAVAVEDGPAGELFLGTGSSKTWDWVRDAEWRMPVI